MSVIVVAHHLSVVGTDEYWYRFSSIKNEDVIIFKPLFWQEHGIFLKNNNSFSRFVRNITFFSPFSKKRKQNIYFFLNIIKLCYYLYIFKPRYDYIMNTTNSLICLQFVLLKVIFNFKLVAWASRLEKRNFYKVFGITKGIIFSFFRFINKLFVDAIHATSDLAALALMEEKHYCPIFVAPTHAIPPHFTCRFSRSIKKTAILNIGFVGELKDFKGVDILIKAIALSNVPHSLNIIGTGPQQSYLENLASNLGVNYNYLGCFKNEDMPEIYDKIDVLVLPSKGDGVIIEKFGRVLIEGASRGCAVVGSNVGGIPLAIGKKGLIFQDSNHTDLSRIIIKLSNVSNLLKHQKLSYEYALKNYSMNCVVKAFINNVDKNFK